MNPRIQFARTAADLVETDLSVALVYAEISGQFFGEVEARHPDRVVNVGIREQLLVNVGAGLALTGMRPIVHTFGSFLVERAFEQVKLGFGHQDVGGVLVGSGGSFDIASGGRTHQTPGDVALVDTSPGSASTRRSTAREVDVVLRARGRRGRAALRARGRADQRDLPRRASGFHVVRRGAGATVIALGTGARRGAAGHRGAGRHRALRPLGAAVRRPRAALGPVGAPRWCSSSRGWRARRRTSSPTRSATCRTGCSHSAYGRDGAAPLRHRRGPRPRPRPGRRRAACLGRPVPRRRSGCLSR